MRCGSVAVDLLSLAIIMTNKQLASAMSDSSAANTLPQLSLTSHHKNTLLHGQKLGWAPQQQGTLSRKALEQLMVKLNTHVEHHLREQKEQPLMSPAAAITDIITSAQQYATDLQSTDFDTFLTATADEEDEQHENQPPSTLDPILVDSILNDHPQQHHHPVSVSKTALSSTYLPPIIPLQSQKLVTRWPSTTPATTKAVTTEVKPKLLQQLETILQHHLSKLNPQHAQYPQVELLAYKQIFRLFSQSFVVYQPLLEVIRSKYEQYIHQQAQLIRTIPDMQLKLNTAEQRTNEKLGQQQVQHSSLQNLYESEIRDLKLHVQHLEAEKSTQQHQLEMLQRQCAERTESYNEIYQSNKTLSAALRRYQDNALQEEERANRDRLLVSTLTEEKSTLQKNYGNLVDELHLIRQQQHEFTRNLQTSSEYQNMQNSLTELQQTYTSLQAAYQQRNEEYTALLQLYDEVVEERTQSAVERAKYADVLMNNTPRPQWRRLLTDHKCEHITNTAGPTTATAPVAATTTAAPTVRHTEEYIELLFGELDKQRNELNEWHIRFPSLEDVDQERAKAAAAALANDKNHRQPWLKCLGDDLTVPKYLRQKGKVRNKLMSKRETELSIQEVWREKYSTSETKQQPLQDYLYAHLKQRYNIHEKICDYAYNFLDACDRYSEDPDCRLFLAILNGEVTEQLYKDQLQMVQQLQTRLVEMDNKLHSGKVKHRLQRKELLDICRAFFSTKGDDNLKLLNVALMNTDSHTELHYLNLFVEDREGNQTEFLECLREQHVTEVFEFTSQVYERLRVLSNAVKAGGERQQLLVREVRQVFNEFDPAKRDDEVDVVVRGGCNLKDDFEVKDDYGIGEIEAFIQNCAKVLIKRSGRPKSNGAAADTADAAESDAGATPSAHSTPSRGNSRSVVQRKDSTIRSGKPTVPQSPALASPKVGVVRRPSVLGETPKAQARHL